jgi:hypothetical protein
MIAYEDLHECYVQNLTKKVEEESKFIFYDYETYVHEGQHKVALVIAMYGHSDRVFDFETNTLFYTWLFAPRHRGYTCIAHNGAKYDMHFIKRQMIQAHKKSQDICSGSSIFYMSTTDLRFIDSFKFIPMALRQFPKTFGLVELHKGYFPYRFLNEETLRYVGPYPSIDLYDFHHLKEAEHREALQWYEENCNDVFDMESVIMDYCMSDVRLLKEGCLEYRRLFMEATEGLVDPFHHITIASTCMAIYRMMDMPRDSIARLHDTAEEAEERNWVVYYLSSHYQFTEMQDWVAYDEAGSSYQIQYCIGDLFHIRISAIIGNPETPELNTALLYLDCYTSGCSLCHRRSEVHPHHVVSMRELAMTTEHALQGMKQRFAKVVIMRRCEWTETRKTEKLVGDVLTAPLRMRDAFFGGRTEPIKLYAECGQEKIGYVDFTSLYPSVQSGSYRCPITGELLDIHYPVGHPVRPLLFSKNPSEYFGFMKVLIDVPKHLYHTVLPIRHDGKLVFPVGRLTGTWTTIELEEAVRIGCEIIEVYDVLVFEQTTTQLFASYVSRFMKMKIEAGGWAKTGIDSTDPEAVEEFIRTNQQLWNITIDPTKLSTYNSGLYYISKLALNSLWGKFAQRPNLGKCIDTFDNGKFNDICFNPRNTVNSIYLHDSSARTIKFKTKSHGDEDSGNTNIAVAAFTTAHARLRLFKLLHHLDRRVLYYDTDSVIYRYINPLPTLPYLGDLTNELDPGDYITTFVSTGPKSYAYQTYQGKSCIKVKGFTLNTRNAEVINFDSMKSLVINKDKLRVSTMQFDIGQDHSISTCNLDRTLQFTSDKRTILWPQGDFEEIDSIPLIIV